jgi:hypothetical protein
MIDRLCDWYTAPGATQARGIALGADDECCIVHQVAATQALPAEMAVLRGAFSRGR